ncbi:hypothetical protein BGZ57DRAFT_914767 [Hyaloscypha finlandica]|nr:hypothetical protein BGZ57DRAFT_914767 [Hyaloscypha finlandica]
MITCVAFAFLFMLYVSTLYQLRPSPSHRPGTPDKFCSRVTMGHYRHELSYRGRRFGPLSLQHKNVRELSDFAIKNSISADSSRRADEMKSYASVVHARLLHGRLVHARLV